MTERAYAASGDGGHQRPRTEASALRELGRLVDQWTDIQGSIIAPARWSLREQWDAEEQRGISVKAVWRNI